MAKLKEEEEVKPKPAYLAVYLPNEDSGNVSEYSAVIFREGENRVKAINLVSPKMVVVEMEDGQHQHFCGFAFQYNKYPEPIKKYYNLNL